MKLRVSLLKWPKNYFSLSQFAYKGKIRGIPRNIPGKEADDCCNTYHFLNAVPGVRSRGGAALTSTPTPTPTPGS